MISLCFQLHSQAALLSNQLQNSCSPVREKGGFQIPSPLRQKALPFTPSPSSSTTVIFRSSCTGFFPPTLKLCCKPDQCTKQCKLCKSNPLSPNTQATPVLRFTTWSQQIQQRGEQQQAAKTRRYLTDTASVLCFSDYMIKLQKTHCR